MNALCSIEGCDQPVKARGWCNPHYGRWKRYGSPTGGNRIFRSMPYTQRFWLKVDKEGALPDHNPELGCCWLWTDIPNKQGYADFCGPDGLVSAHRWAYMDSFGAIPEGLEIDHLCRVRHCVNPGHLEAVTHAENVRRGIAPAAANAAKTHCKRGHPFDAENTYMRLDGGRTCRACQRVYQHEYERDVA